jgi:UDP-GlcNAc:undecaprenyl-phosphate GlcNAc-1-phosphate transferase
MPRLTASTYLWPLLVSCAAAAAATFALRWAAPRLGMLDQPDRRKNHARPMPLLGGLAIYLAVALAYLLFGTLNLRTAWLLAGSLLMLAVGLWDDRVGLRARGRLSFQALGAAGMIAVGICFRWFHWAPADYLVSALWLVGLTNAMNCLDCCDGIAAGVAATGAGAFFVIALAGGHASAALIAVSLLGACAGFAVFNFPPASIFLGDAGSTLLGLLLGGLAIESTWDLSPIAQPCAAALPMAVPVWDIVVVHARRYLRGTRNARALLESTGHDHLPHRLRQMPLGGPPGKPLTARQTAFAVYLMSASLALPTALLIGRPGGLALMITLAAAALVFGERPFGLVAARLTGRRAASESAPREHISAAAE